MSQDVISLKKVACQAGHRYLLSDINLNIQQGQDMIILGENGSGKTTLLSIIAGMKRYSQGSVSLFGQSLAENNVIELRKQVGFVSTSFFDRYYKPESVLNIVLSGKCGTFGIDHTVKEEDIVEAKALLRGLNLIHRMDYPFSFLSKGERQNVLLARALLQRPKILLLDEPMSGLDVLNRKKVMGLLSKLANRDDITMLYVTHRLDEISDELFEHALLLRFGRIYQQGSTKDILQDDVMSGFFRHKVSVSRDADGYYGMKVVD